MATTPTQTHPKIDVIHGKAVTSSLAVAEYFCKQHKNVIQKIQTLECSVEFTELNFQPSDYTDCTGRKLPCYQITRDGFAFLAMGFTGKRAARFKEAYINAFNQMEKNYLVLTRLICQLSHETPEAYTCICVKSIKSGQASFIQCLRPLNLRWLANCTTVLVMLFLALHLLIPG